MSIEFVFRILGMIVFAIIGASFGVSAADTFNLPEDANALLFSLVGALFGLIVSPWLTTRPAKSLRRMLMESPIEILLNSLIGLVVGLFIALLLVWPLSLLPGWLGQYAPIISSLIASYFCIVLFSSRTFDILNFFRHLSGASMTSILPSLNVDYGVILDTSVIIDGRILDISKSGFIQGILYVPQFVLSELHNIANSSDPIRRQRGRHGLEILNKLKQEGMNPVQVIDDNPEAIEAVDAKLVEVAKIRTLPLMTNDFNLNSVAGVHGVQVLNLNDLSLALQPALLPGEELDIRIIQEGREPDQGVGYLEDGTMVVVEGGKRYLDRSLTVVITRYIRSAAGKMYFAIPERDTHR
ncbi:MAG: PIN domain nuclease [Anaerolineae bacterium]|nr:PIN domain nuclease [Anaerolineae bacterium]